MTNCNRARRRRVCMLSSGHAHQSPSRAFFLPSLRTYYVMPSPIGAERGNRASPPSSQHQIESTRRWALASAPYATGAQLRHNGGLSRLPGTACVSRQAGRARRKTTNKAAMRWPKGGVSVHRSLMRRALHPKCRACSVSASMGACDHFWMGLFFSAPPSLGSPPA